MAINPSDQFQKENKEQNPKMQDNTPESNNEINKEVSQSNNDLKCHYCLKEYESSFICKQCNTHFCFDCINQVKLLKTNLGADPSTIQEFSNGICSICLKECLCSRCNTSQNTYHPQLEINCLLCNSNHSLINIDELLSKVIISDEKKRELMQDKQHPITKVLLVEKDKRVICQHCRLNNEAFREFFNEKPNYDPFYNTPYDQRVFINKDIMDNYLKSFEAHSESRTANQNFNNKDNENQSQINTINSANSLGFKQNSSHMNPYSGNDNAPNLNLIQQQQFLMQLQQMKNIQYQQHPQSQLTPNPVMQFMNNTMLKAPSSSPSSMPQQGINSSLKCKESFSRITVLLESLNEETFKNLFNVTSNVNHLSAILLMYTKVSLTDNNTDAMIIFGKIIQNIQKQILMANNYNLIQRELILNVMNILQRSIEYEAMNQMQINPMGNMLNSNSNMNLQYNPFLSSLLNAMPIGSPNATLSSTLNLNEVYNQTQANQMPNTNPHQAFNQMDNQKNSNTMPKSQLNTPNRNINSNTNQAMRFPKESNMNENLNKANTLNSVFQPFMNHPLVSNSSNMQNIQMSKIAQKYNNTQIPTMNNQNFMQSQLGYDQRYQQAQQQLQLNDKNAQNQLSMNQNKQSPPQNEQNQKKKEE